MMMLKTGLRVAALFGAYATIGYGGEVVAGLLAADGEGGAIHIDAVAAPSVGVDASPAVVVDVRPTVVSRIQMRHSGECSFEDERQLVSSATRTTSVEIDAGAGSLHVEGQEGLEEIVVVGRFCASHEEYLEALNFTADDRSDGTVMINTRYPEQRARQGNHTARIDLMVLVPLGMDVRIDDSSGDITVMGTGDLDIDDSSGSIDVSGILGSLDVDDSSGGIAIGDVEGDVRLDDGSGGVEIRGVLGSVSLRDGSGGIEIEGIDRNVLIESDGAGSIDVRDVGGDFTVERDGSGSIRHSGVEGQVDVPVRRRRGG